MNPKAYREFLLSEKNKWINEKGYLLEKLGEIQLLNEEEIMGRIEDIAVKIAVVNRELEKLGDLIE